LHKISQLLLIMTPQTPPPQSSNFELLSASGITPIVRLKDSLSIFMIDPRDRMFRIQKYQIKLGVPFDDTNFNLDAIKPTPGNSDIYEYYQEDKNQYVLLKQDLFQLEPQSSHSFFRENAQADKDSKIFNFRFVGRVSDGNMKTGNIFLSRNEIENKLIVEPVPEPVPEPGLEPGQQRDGGSRRSKKYLYNSSKSKKSKRMGSTARRALLLKKRK
jgi:hypothetical protein